MLTSRLVTAACLAVLVWLSPAPVRSQQLGNHLPAYDDHGLLMPWTSWDDAVRREMNWYAQCPVEHGYPRFVFLTFMDGSYVGRKGRFDIIPAMQNGMGIISYLKYDEYTDGRDARVLATARAMGDYLVREDLTPDSGKYPRFSRSTGKCNAFPQPADCGSQSDLPYEVEPDKGGIVGYALMLLYQKTRESSYLLQALQNAKVLVANMRAGDASHSPLPFRADYRTGAPRGDVSADMVYILRLFDKLIQNGHPEFTEPRQKLWRWIKDFQIPSGRDEGKLWVQFFEDQDDLNNRNSWSALNMARYLLESRQQLDPDWKEDALSLIQFASQNFAGIWDGVPVCGEQDADRKPWGGANSTYGAVVAMYCKATGDMRYAAVARQALNYCVYALNEDGCPCQAAFKPGRGGWQEDSHTDKIHNFIDAMRAFPAWAR